MQFSTFFKHTSSSAGTLFTTIAVSIPYALALNYTDHCKQHNEAMSFSNYLSFSTSLMKAIMKDKPILHNNHKHTEVLKNRRDALSSTLNDAEEDHKHTPY